MSANNSMPLVFFENLLEYDKSIELRDLFLSEFLEEIGNSIAFDKIDIDYNKGIIKYWGSYFDEQKHKYVDGFINSSFETNFNAKINAEYRKSKILLDDFVTEIVSKGSNPNEFLRLQMTILKSLYLKLDVFYLEKPSIKSAIVALKEYIHNKYSIEIPKLSIQEQNISNDTNPDDYSPLSFCWDSIDNSARIENLTHLYSLLVRNPAIIECTQEEFINAFTQKKVENGIKWLLTGKNGSVSKSLLFYFLDFLNEGTYINTVPSIELNKRIEYVFRDSQGNVLKNIRQSKNYSKESLPFGYKILDVVFSELK